MLGAVLLRKNYEELLPISCSMIVFILFAFGMDGRLIWGFYSILLLSVAVYILSIVRIIKGKLLCADVFKSLFSPAFFIFLFFIFLIAFCEKG